MFNEDSYDLVYIGNISSFHTYGKLYKVYPEYEIYPDLFVSCDDSCIRWVIKECFISLSEWRDILINKII
jgi:hypothetical protein